MFGLLLVGGLFVLNFLISWWNARAVGKIWVETKQAGGWYRFIAWMGAAMSAAGFTWCYLTVIGIVLGVTGKLTYAQLDLLFNLGYVLIVPVVLFAGYALTFESWRQAFHRHSLGNMGVAGWNTFASAYNTYNAVQGFGPALKSIGNGFSSLSRSKNGAALVLVLAILALCIGGGTLTTAALIHHYAAQEELELVAQRAGRPEYARW